MKTSHYKIVGIVLLAVAFLVAIAWQVFGSGLVSKLPAPPPRVFYIQDTLGAHFYDEVTVYHVFRMLALASIALLGLACILRGRSHETNA